MPIEPTQNAIASVVTHLRRSKRVLVITGAGLSADSGLPTYRGIGGLYSQGNTAEGYPVEVALSGEMFRQRPEITWRHIRDIERACRRASFNRGHEVIAKLEEHVDSLWVLTQNVDGFHKQAGSTQVIDIHGDVHDLLCTRCTFTERVHSFDALAPLPRCGKCAAVLRPDVVLFGELLPAAKVARMREELSRGFDLVLSVGTTSLFPYIAGPVVDATRSGAPTVEINPGHTPVSSIVNIKIPETAATALDAIHNALLASA